MVPGPIPTAMREDDPEMDEIDLEIPESDITQVDSGEVDSGPLFYRLLDASSF